jgi:imidazolonepropionase-like amidohydrolase
MTDKNFVFHVKILVTILVLAQGLSFNASAEDNKKHCQVLIADRVFDGFNLHENAAVLFKGNKIIEVGEQNQFNGICNHTMDLGDATILPGFIESHAHLTFQNVSSEIVLKHGITTVRDTGGPLLAPIGGTGKLRLLSTGPIIQAVDGYPLNIFGGDDGGYDKIGIHVASTTEAEKVVTDLVTRGATAIKIALEPGGETGAPWMQPHDGPVPPTPWPMLSLDTTSAIVAKAHSLGKRVIAHVGENTGFERALNAGVDELAHIPCAEISEGLLQRAVDQGVIFVTTIDTLSSCVDTATHKGIHSNTMSLANKGAKFIYGSEIGHDNVPWGINGEEMALMLHLTSGDAIDFMDVLNVFKAATSEAGKNLGNPLLGTLLKDAPADIIAVRGNPFLRFKLLEYPDMVISGGHIIVNNFKKNKENH